MDMLADLAMRARASVSVRGARRDAEAGTRPGRWPARLAALLLVPALGAVGAAQAQSCAVGETPAAFAFTGGEQVSVVPGGVTSARIVLSGAQGGTGRSGAGTIGGSPNSPGGAGGLGGRVQGTLAVTPGQTLSVWVGGQASQAVNPGGIGQGVDGIGGGATDIRVGGNAIGNRAAIAGGGGGGGNAGWSTANVIAGGAGGVGGGGVGAAGATVPGGVGPFGGGGGAVGTGGTPGAGCGGFPATAGNAANGNGGDSNNFSGSFVAAGFGGGGGGGATIGAGGGGADVGTTGCQQNWNGGGGGGAGGSSGATGLTGVTINNGVQTGNGAALICYVAPSFAFTGTAIGQTGPVTLQLVGSSPASTQQVVVAQGAATFAFPTRLSGGANWNVNILSQPASQACTVTPASGAAVAADVALALTCTTVTVTIAPATVPGATFATAYAQTLSASSANGATAPYAFAVVAGALPGGLGLSTAGALSGTPTASGTFNFTVQATSANGFSGSQAYALTVAQASQAITGFAASPAAPVFAPGGSFTVSATGGASTSPVVFASTTPVVCTVSGPLVTILRAGSCGLTADQAGDSNYSAAPQVSLAVAIAQASQAITNFTATPAVPVFSPGGTFTLSATGGASTSAVLFGSTTPTVCTVSGSTVAMLGAGTCVVTADQAGDANYAAAPQALLAVTIAQAGQTITSFVATPAAPVYAPGGTFTVSATGGASTTPVVFASTSPAVCTVSGGTVSMLAAGTCALTANQAGDANYTAAPQVALNVAIGLATQAITSFTATPAAPVFSPGGTFTVSATGGASTSPVVFASTSPAVCTVGGNSVTMLAAGTCALTANQAGDANYAAAPQVALNVAIGVATQAITNLVATPAAPVFTPGGTFTVSATSGASSSPVVFASTTAAVCTVSGSTVTMLGAGTCALTANQAGDANYAAAPQVTLDVVIGLAGQQITGFAATPSAPVFVPNGTFTVSATGGASTSPVVFASTSPTVCTVSGSTVTMLTAGTCALTADQAGDANYAAAPQVTLDVAIGVASQAITNFAATPASAVFTPGGTFTVSASGGASSSPVVFGSTTPAVCTVSGSTVTMVAAGTCALTADQAGDASYGAAPQVTLDVVIGAATQSITGFTATPAAPVFAPNGTFTVSATGGASTSPVVFASTTPTVCTVSGGTVTMRAAGTCTLTADQAADANYGAAPQVSLNVAIAVATPTLRWIGDLQKSVGETAFDLPDPTSDSAGAFTFSSSNPAVATVSGRRVTIVGGGVATLVATQAATGSYAQGTASATLTVSDRPDPTRDPGVISGLQAQVDASVRFASAQQTNIHDRLRQQRYSDANASSNGVSLSMSNGMSGASLAAPQLTPTSAQPSSRRWAVWSAGVITTGDRDGRNGSDGFDFRSDGITVGADWRGDGGLLFGVAGGFGWNDTDIDGSRSGLDADQRSLSVYGQWRAGEHVFVDGLFGWGQLDFDITRWSDTAGAAAKATRDGDQAFGSLTLGYEHSDGNLLLTGYGRIDTSKTTLDGYRETGLGIYDLMYRRQHVDTSSMAVGVEGSYLFGDSASQVRPYWMVEYRDAFENRSDVALNYVVAPVATDYTLGLRSYGDHAFTYGAGVDVSFAARWRVSLLFRREQASGQTDASSFGLLFSYSPRLPMRAEQVEVAPTSEAPATGR